MSKRKTNSPKQQPHHPFAKFFEAAFSRLHIVVDFVENILPDYLAKNIQTDTLELGNDSFVTEDLKRLWSDIIYKCKYGKDEEEVWLTLLFDHKSQPDNFVYIQLSKYMDSIWERQRADKKVPKVIVPIIFYHGKRKWKVKPFEEMFSGVPEELKKFVPKFEFILVDLRDYSDEDILNLKAGFLINTLLAFKHYHNEQYIRENFALIVTEYSKVNDVNFVTTLFVFLSEITEIRKEDIPKLIKESSNNYSDMSTYDVIKTTIQENTLIEKVRNMHKKKYSLEVIADALELEIEYVKKVISGEIQPFDIYGNKS